jgi:protein-tyrosine-phosphatase
MAEGFLKNFFLNQGIDVIVKSGGISSNARDGMLISMDARLAMKEIGIVLSQNDLSTDIKKHPEFIMEADLILTLTNQHKKEIHKFICMNNKQVFTIKEFAGGEGDIEDPSMKELEGVRGTRNEIVESLMRGLNKYSF